jgi:hypothetical protein
VTALLYLRRDDSGYVHGGEHFTPAQASCLIEPYLFAARSRFDGSLVAGDSRDQVAPYGEPRFGPDLAQEVYVPDWFCVICGCSGSVDDDDCDHDCASQGIGVHR